MKSLLVITGLLVCLGVVTAPVVGAVDSEARLEVAPLSCLFEQVSDGSSDLTYLSPAECGPVIGEVPHAGSDPLVRVPTTVAAAVPSGARLTQTQVRPDTDSRNANNPLVRMTRAGRAFVSNPAYSSVTAIIVAPVVITAAVPTLRFRFLRRLLRVKNLILPR
ncbi:MAG TPA: hypothetical protein VK674_07300 [Candidatus Limnocylindria bacterium]|nr:hypothetical protein [Candidatus Limnocylindria bacterium]